MNCDQVRQCLSNQTEIDTASIRAHIGVCASCARAYEAERLLRASFHAVRSQIEVWDKPASADEPVATASARAVIERVVGNQGEPTMAEVLKHPLVTPKRRWGISLAVAAALLIIGVLVPFSYDHTVGTRLVLTSESPAMAEVNLTAVNAALAQAGWDGARVEREADALVYLVPGNSDQALAAFRATQDALPVLPADVGITVEPWTVRESGSLLAQIAGTFEITIESDGKTEQEIADDIRSQLLARGASVQSVTVQKSASGETTINLDGVTAPPGTVGEGGEATIELKTKGDGAMTTQLFFEAPDPNLSDAEKIEAIKRQLAARGITDANVTISNGAITVEAMQKK